MSTAAARAKAHFECSSCGTASPRWAGRCSGCGEWNTLLEVVERVVAGRAAVSVAGAAAASLADVRPLATERSASGLAELDRVLGGGLVPGSLVLLGGDPGIGKSTLALQLAHAVGTVEQPSLYCAGEESAAQLAMRAARLGCASGRIEVIAETDLDILLATITERRPAVCVVDSVQTVFDSGIAGVPGSPSQVRAAVARLMACAKQTAVSIVLVGHVTKEGAIAGPRTLEHMVDVVLYLEGERSGEHRLLRGIKNRFGTTGELGLFCMAQEGMVALDAPGRAFLDEASLDVAGNVLTVTCEGVRPIAVEVQALAVATPFGLPRRTASGFDLGRLNLLLAVLEKRGRIALGQSDVYLNAVGGVRLNEPAVDLAVLLAVAGSAKDRALPESSVVMGEVGLGGEVRRVRRLDARLSEAAQLGITTAIVPAGHAAPAPRGLRLQRVSTVTEALALLR